MLLVLLVLLDTGVQPELPRQWAQFSRTGALSHISETVDIATGDRDKTAAFAYKLRLTRRMLGSDPQIAWADSGNCPAILPVIESMQNIKMPTPAPYGLPGPPIAITMDGAGYFLAAPSSDNMGKFSISSNVGSSLASWIDASFAQLKPCWVMATGQ